jgi:hypothetical protein
MEKAAEASIPTSPPHSTIWQLPIKLRVKTLRQNHSTVVPWASWKNHEGRTILTWPPVSTTWRWCASCKQQTGNTGTGDESQQPGGGVQAAGRFGEAEPLYRRALAILENDLRPDHPAVVTTLENMASRYNSMGKPSQARELLFRAEQIRSKQ